MNDPNGFEVRLARIRRFIASGNLVEARKQNDSLIVDFPSNVGGYIQRSRIESIDDNYRLAKSYALKAFQAGAEEKRDMINLLRRLKTFGLIKELNSAITGLQAPLLRDPEVLNLACLFLNALNEPERALTYVEIGLAHEPDSVPLQLSRGQTLVYLGRFDEAEEFLLQCLDKRPGLAFAWWLLSRLRKQHSESNHVAQLKRELAEAMHPDDIAFLAYALHKELDDLGDIDGAAQALAKACKVIRATRDYSSAEDRALFSAIKAMPPTGLLPVPISPPLTPIFIVGMHRSGTSLLEQFLDGHPQIFCAGELYDFTGQMRDASDHHCSREIDLHIVKAAASINFEEVGRGYLAAVGARVRNERFITDKLPSNFLNLGFIFRALPHAKVIHMVRDPVETCFSNLREFFSETTCLYSNDQVELADYYKQYESLMLHWHAQFPGRILDVSYKDLVENSERNLREVMAFLGLEYLPAMLDTATKSRSVTTASVVQVRNRAALPEKPKWEAYKEYLRPLIQQLERENSA